MSYTNFVSQRSPGLSGISSININPQDAHLHATLETIDQLANDVEMQRPLLEELTFLILDTNILIHYFDVIQQFTADVENMAVPVIIIIPGIVLRELDGQKNRDGLAWFARRASAWLLRKVKERQSVKVQAQDETSKASGNWKVRDADEDFGDGYNDYLIVDCALYHTRRDRRTFLCSKDFNLCTQAESTDIRTIQPSQQWSSQELAYSLFGGEIDRRKFGAYSATYKESSKPQATRNPHDDDGMDIDEDSSLPARLLPSHALDLLHIQVIQHFTSLLLELVGRVGGSEIHLKSDTGASQSVHAPTWSRKEYRQWCAAECLEYLNTKRRSEATQPRVEIFLTMPYTGRGARRGQDWSRRDWEVALGGLGAVGDLWEEISVRESLLVLEPHLQSVFATPMRPTGIGHMI